MTNLTTSLIATTLALVLLNIALTRQAVRPVSSCEWQSLAELRSMPPLKGTLPEFVEPPTAEEFAATFDTRTE